MPMITVNLRKELQKTQKDTLVAELGRSVTLLPNKTEDRLMIQIMDHQSLYFAGSEADCAYVAVTVYGVMPPEAKSEYVQQLFCIMESVCQLSKDLIYITISELPNWGTGGIYK